MYDDEDLPDDLIDNTPMLKAWTEESFSVPHIVSFEELIMLVRGALYAMHLSHGFPKPPRDDRSHAFRLFTAVAREEKVATIKVVREISGHNLKASKNIVDAIYGHYQEEVSAIQAVMQVGDQRALAKLADGALPPF